MSLIEGIGDEVIFFVVAAIAAVVFMILAWKSTEVNDQSIAAATNTTSVAFTVTQVVLQARSTADGNLATAAAATPSTATTPPLLTESPPQEEESLPPLNPDVILSHQASGTGCQTSAPLDQAEATSSSSNNEHDEKEMKAVLELMDDETSAAQQTGEDAAECTLRRRNLETASEPKPKETISIRLKYMDDTQRIVESPPSTTISNFKRLHFQSDLAAGKVIKLIYNGQVLSDSATLSELGLDNNCVVHCLVHQARRPANPTDAITNNREQENLTAGQQQHFHHFFTGDPLAQFQQHMGNNQQGNAAAAEAGIDIGGLLVPLFGVILGLVWYCRIAYAAHFTAAATLSLVGLSGLCLFSFLALRYPGVLDS